MDVRSVNGKRVNQAAYRNGVCRRLMHVNATETTAKKALVVKSYKKVVAV
jgi:hypothetical protein